MLAISKINSAVKNGRSYHYAGDFEARVAVSSICLNNLEPTDDDLICLIASKDKRAMRTLYTRHCQRVFRFLVRIMKDATLAEDVVSDVFLDVWRKASQFQAKSTVPTWLLGIARHRAYSALRRCREAQLDERYAAAIADSGENPEVSTENRDRSLVLEKCLRTLSKVHQEVIKLIYYEERSVGEVAEILGVPLATVKTRAFYARNRMAQMLKAYGIQHACS